MRRYLTYAMFVVIAAVLAVPALAGKGGNGGGNATSGGGGGGGHIDPTSFAISSDAPGSVTFSVVITTQGNGGSPSLEVTNTCYDNMSVANYSQTLSVSWASPTQGYAGAFAPLSGEKCFAYVHVPGSTTPLENGSFSYVAL
jgi:hypothetical protein